MIKSTTKKRLILMAIVLLSIQSIAQELTTIGETPIADSLLTSNLRAKTVIMVGAGSTLLNRNINLFVQIILISLSRGIDNFYFKHKHNTKYLIFVPLIFFIAQIASFGITLHDDFKVDSRIQAYRWIVDNKIDKYPINTNDHSLADGIKEINDTVYIFNEINNENYDYYIVNGWGESDIVSVKFPNILFVQNHSNDHFRYINNKDYLSSNLFIQEKINSNEHELIARFKGNGPLIYIFKNK